MSNQSETITVLYYDQNNMSAICSEVLTNVQVSLDERVIFPSTYRDDKIIVAVLDGICNVRNSLGDRNIYF